MYRRKKQKHSPNTLLTNSLHLEIFSKILKIKTRGDLPNATFYSFLGLHIIWTDLDVWGLFKNIRWHDADYDCGSIFTTWTPMH